MADRNLNIRVAFSALNNMSRPVNAARQSAAALASQINQTKTSIKGLERQATSFDRLTAANKKTTEQICWWFFVTTKINSINYLILVSL